MHTAQFGQLEEKRYANITARLCRVGGCTVAFAYFVAMRSSAKLAARLLRSSQSRSAHAALTTSKFSFCPRFLSLETSRLSEKGADTARQTFQSRYFSTAATSEPLPSLSDVVKEELEFERGPEGSVEVSLHAMSALSFYCISL